MARASWETTVSEGLEGFLAELDIGERGGQPLVLLDRDVARARDLDNLLADRAPALGDDARRAFLVVMQRDRELAVVGGLAHVARSR